MGNVPKFATQNFWGISPKMSLHHDWFKRFSFVRDFERQCLTKGCVFLLLVIEFRYTCYNARFRTVTCSATKLGDMMIFYAGACLPLICVEKQGIHIAVSVML